MNRKEKLENWAAFACAMQQLREDFSEHGREIDRCVSQVGQKLETCGDPNCTCRMTFENFNAVSIKKMENKNE